MAQLDHFIGRKLGREDDESFDLFWGDLLDRDDELPNDVNAVSEDVHDAWFSFDYRLPNGLLVVEAFLQAVEVSASVRTFLRAVAASTMRLYEVRDVVPGFSITLCDLVEGDVVTVRERSASRQLSRHDCLATRVIARGCSGEPEMERAPLQFPGSMRDTLVGLVRERRDAFMGEYPKLSLERFYETLPPFFHEVWLSCFLRPALPELANTDGETLVLTRLTFDVLDTAVLERALDGSEREGIERDEGRSWRWTGAHAKGGSVLLAKLEIREDRLVVETNSVERGERAREQLVKLAGSSLEYRASSHEDMQRRVLESMSAQHSSPPKEPRDALDLEIQEALVSDHYARHYRAWLDEPVPALDGETPRRAATNRGLRARVEDLIRGLEGLYERALKSGQPAYDPSWMWDELSLAPLSEAARPPPLAHERVAERVPGSAEVSQAAAERHRARLGFDDAATTLCEEELQLDLELQRFLRERPSQDEAGHALAAPYISLMVNLDLHRRKIFWVDHALAYMLDSTDVDLAADELRPPFPSFALVFSDRHSLSLAERLLARRPDDPLRGQILRVATVYITECAAEPRRTLDVVFALDALGADLPSLVRFELPVGSETSLRAYLDGIAPRPVIEPPTPDANPSRGLLRLVINAILYATSAGVTPEDKPVEPRPRARPATSAAASDSGSIYYLPGKIDIRRVRQLQALARAPGGRALLARFIVRGHWRRAAPGWADRRLRWIEPYWKGPDMATAIERAYRLKQ